MVKRVLVILTILSLTWACSTKSNGPTGPDPLVGNQSPSTDTSPTVQPTPSTLPTVKPSSSPTIKPTTRPTSTPLSTPTPTAAPTPIPSPASPGRSITLTPSTVKAGGTFNATGCCVGGAKKVGLYLSKGQGLVNTVNSVNLSSLDGSFNADGTIPKNTSPGDGTLLACNQGNDGFPDSGSCIPTSIRIVP